MSVVCPGHSYTTYGGPAVHPRNTCTPSFTEQDVRDYVHHNPHALFGKIVVDGTPTITSITSITSITFTTIRDLSRVSSDDEYAANYPADMVVCVVELKGTFIEDGPLFGDGSLGATIRPFHAAFSLLDAHTGNELMDGGGTPFK